MKTIKTLLLLFLFLINIQNINSQSITLSPDGLSFNSSEGTKYFYVYDATASGWGFGYSWLNITPRSAFGQTETKVTVICSANSGGDS